MHGKFYFRNIIKINSPPLPQIAFRIIHGSDSGPLGKHKKEFKFSDTLSQDVMIEEIKNYMKKLISQQLKEQGVPIKDISEYTGLTRNEINDL